MSSTPAFPVEKLGPNELNEYDFANLPPNLKWLVYWYECGSYEGSGCAAWANSDGTYGYTNLGHCSCYGPTGDNGIIDVRLTSDEVARGILGLYPSDHDKAVADAFDRKIKEGA